MDNRVYQIKYIADGTVFETSELQTEHFDISENVSDEAFSLDITPKTKIELVDISVSFDKDFADDDKFFAGGYQSWTTTKELSKKNVQRGVTKLSKLSKKAYQLAAISSDDDFVKYSDRPGDFHSVTYTYIRNKSHLDFYGSLSEREGYTIFEVKMTENKFTIRKDVEGAVIDAPRKLFDIVMFSGEYDEVFDKYFEAMKVPKCRIDHMSGYTSWYNYFQKIDENIILRDLDGLDSVKDSVSIFQIDDGYETFVGDWLDPNPSRFPNGLKYVVDKIHDKGYMAGLWVAPFSCQKVSRTAKEHPDWLIKDKDGKPELGVFAWGGAYTLDIYNDEAREYIKHCFDVILGEWGFDMVKLDFLYSQCKTPRNGKSRGQIMCEAMDFLRECVGDKLFLGCGVPIGPSFGVVDACRISCDVDLVYKGKYYNKLGICNELPSAQNAMTSTMFRRHLDGRVWVNDPDVFFLRDNNLKFTDEQKLLLAHINNICGNVLFVSDNVGDYNMRGIKLIEKFFKKSSAKITEIDECDENIYKIKYTEDGKKKVLTFNLSKGTILK